MSLELSWKVGFEVELMAPRGASRRDLAERTAHRVAGRIVHIFHPDTEPSTVKGSPIFENLTPGFRVEDANGEWVASFVDDLTLQADFDRAAAPKPGWFRIVSDDRRFIRLIEQQCDAAAPIDVVLEPLAALFGTTLDTNNSGMIRVMDARDTSVAMAAPLPGERERPCEIVTAPIVAHHQAVLSQLLDDAIALGFSIPRESATHIHFDAKPLRSSAFIARFVKVVSHFGGDLRQLVNANPACVRLGQWPPELAVEVAKPDFTAMNWDEARATLLDLKLTKYCDFNLVNMISQNSAKDTLEIRILPGMIDAASIVRHARLFEALLTWCLQSADELPASIVALLQALPLDADDREFWLGRI